MPWRYIEVKSTDPAFNLALEEYVFKKLSREYNYFILWQNNNTMVIGRHQNTMAEVDAEFVRQNGIRVVRRLSGGGAVYHDMGNLNFTYIQDAQSSTPDLYRFCCPVAEAVRELGADARVNGRNDITVNGMKFSGNAQYVKNGRVMHHGTLLFDENLETAARALRPDPEKIKAKGVASVRSRITNLKPLLAPGTTMEMFRAALLQKLFKDRPMEKYTLTEEDTAAISALRDSRYDTWDWNWGASPPCDAVFSGRIEGCGKIELHCRIQKGKISEAALRGDFFSASDPDELAACFIGCAPGPEGCEAALRGKDVSRIIIGLTNEKLLEILTK